MPNHTKPCLAAALICAVENMRDSPDWDADGMRVGAVDGELLRLADKYLADGLVGCRCPTFVTDDPRYRTRFSGCRIRSYVPLDDNLYDRDEVGPMFVVALDDPDDTVLHAFGHEVYVDGVLLVGRR